MILENQNRQEKEAVKRNQCHYHQDQTHQKVLTMGKTQSKKKRLNMAIREIKQLIRNCLLLVQQKQAKSTNHQKVKPRVNLLPRQHKAARKSQGSSKLNRVASHYQIQSIARAYGNILNMSIWNWERVKYRLYLSLQPSFYAHYTTFVS